MFKQLLQRRPQAKLIKYPSPMKADEVANVFNDMGEDSKIWQALDTIIDNHLLDAVNEVADPQLSSQQTSHAAGRIDAISTLKGKLEEFRKWKNGKNSYRQS